MSEQLPEYQHDEVVDATIPGRLLVVLAGLFFVGVLALIVWGIVRFTRGDATDAPTVAVSSTPAPSVSAPPGSPAPSTSPSTPPTSTPPVVVRRAPVVVPTPVVKKPAVRPTPAPIVVTTTGPSSVGFSRVDIGYSTIVAVRP